MALRPSGLENSAAHLDGRAVARDGLDNPAERKKAASLVAVLLTRSEEGFLLGKPVNDLLRFDRCLETLTGKGIELDVKGRTPQVRSCG